MGTLDATFGCVFQDEFVVAEIQIPLGLLNCNLNTLQFWNQKQIKNGGSKSSEPQFFVNLSNSKVLC